jgi:hypothetical protein
MSKLPRFLRLKCASEVSKRPRGFLGLYVPQGTGVSATLGVVGDEIVHRFQCVASTGVPPSRLTRDVERALTALELFLAHLVLDGRDGKARVLILDDLVGPGYPEPHTQV